MTVPSVNKRAFGYEYEQGLVLLLQLLFILTKDKVSKKFELQDFGGDGQTLKLSVLIVVVLLTRAKKLATLL